MTDQIISISTKSALIIGAWVFAQISPLAEMGINRAFDQLFSIGLMMLFLVYMIYENKKKDKKHELSQKEYVGLLKKNTEAIQEFSSSNKDVAKSVERSQSTQNQAFDRLTRAFEKLEQKL